MAIQIPQDWRDVLTKLKVNGFPEAVIAGGALRDLSNGVPVKDVDIFVRHPETAPYFSERMDKAFSSLGWSYMVTKASTDYLNGAFDNVVEVANVHYGPGDLPIQVIALNVEPTADVALARFDFGICQICYDGSATNMTQAFVRDMKDKTFTLIRADNQEQFDRSMERFKRLREKYPKHDLVVPEKFWQFAEYRDRFDPIGNELRAQAKTSVPSAA